jgi:hypothetical protein
MYNGGVHLTKRLNKLKKKQKFVRFALIGRKYRREFDVNSVLILITSAAAAKKLALNVHFARKRQLKIINGKKSITKISKPS